jgi:hypothetical protein
VRDGAVGWVQLIPAWALLGMAYAGLVTPGGRLLRRSARTEHLPQLFAAQFSLSHACWLVAYPLARWMGAKFGLDVALMALTVLCVGGAVFAWKAWPADDAAVLAHEHPDLPPDHPHWAEHAEVPASHGQHTHAYVIDNLHRRWPG